MSHTEIERKFLVKHLNFLNSEYNSSIIKQGYLNSNKNRAVRVRVKNNQGFITVKGISNNTGTSRFEWEKEISVEDAYNLLTLCEPGMISKTRYFIPNGPHTFELDVFDDENDGLVVAEIELNSEEENFHKPEWLGKEVTGENKYYNSQLSKNPYKNW